MKSLLVIIIVLCSIDSLAQGLFKVKNGANVKVKNAGHMVLNNVSIVNDGTLSALNNSQVTFTGNVNDSIEGTNPLDLDILNLNKSSGSFLTLQQNLNVHSHVEFYNGVLDLDQFVLNLGNTGSLINESENSRVFSYLNGYVERTANLSSPSNINPGNLGAIISSSANLGNTIIRRGHHNFYNGYGNSILRYFDIIPTNNNQLRATLTLKYFDAELNQLQESKLNQWKSSFNTTWDLNGSDNRSVIENYVTKANNNKLFRFTLAEAIPPSIICPYDIIESVDPGTCRATVSFTASATGIPNPSLTYYIGNTAISSPYNFPTGNTTVTAIANDGVNEASCSFLVQIIENSAPFIDYCPPSSTLCYNTSNSYSIPTLQASDNCSQTNISFSISGATTRYGTGNNASGLFNVGVSTILWTVSDESGNTSTCETIITIATKGKCTTVSPATINRDDLLVVEQINKGITVSAYPNPANTFFNISINEHRFQPCLIRVYDQLGRLIETKRCKTNSIIQIGQNYQPGLYTAEIIIKSEQHSLKLLKK